MEFPNRGSPGGDREPRTTPIVTLFGTQDVLGRALMAELGRRGSRIHALSIKTGWIPSIDHAVVRLDTDAGSAALQDLSGVEQPTAHVVAVCERPTDPVTREQLADLCRHCGMHHEVALIWHPPLESQPECVDDPVRDGSATTELASVVADQVAEQHPGGFTPSFVSRSFIPQRD